MLLKGLIDSPWPFHTWQNTPAVALQHVLLRWLQHFVSIKLNFKKIISDTLYFPKFVSSKCMMLRFNQFNSYKWLSLLHTKPRWNIFYFRNHLIERHLAVIDMFRNILLIVSCKQQLLIATLIVHFIKIDYLSFKSRKYSLNF